MIYILRLIFSSDSCTDRIIMQNVIYINRPCNKSTQLKWTFIVLTHLKPRYLGSREKFDQIWFQRFFTANPIQGQSGRIFGLFEVTVFIIWANWNNPLFSQSFEINFKTWPPVIVIGINWSTLTYLAPSTHWEFSNGKLKLNVKMAPEM